jgi:acetyl-CoA C-acetyltransferase
MSAPTALIAAWARSAVAPHGGAFRALHAHEIAAPVLRALLQRAQLNPQMLDAVVIGNALGAGGNPARMVALAAGLPDACAAFTLDTQCCAGLDAIAMAVGLLASGQARVVIAGGVEDWSRSPIRHTRPLHAEEPAVAYERPAFAPDPARDPDLLESAAAFAKQQGMTRLQQDAYAMQSHQRALQYQDALAQEIVPVMGLQHDAYVRAVTAQRAARMPLAIKYAEADACAMSTLAVSAKADGAALVLLATPEACDELGLKPQAAWLASASVGGDPALPLVSAHTAAQAAMHRAGIHDAAALQVIELHDAFAVQGLQFCQGLGLDVQAINRRGGGLARGHPIGASGAIAMVRMLADLQRDEAAGARGLAAVAGAGGIGAAAIVQRLQVLTKNA